MDKESSRRSFIKKSAIAGSAALIVPTIVPFKVFDGNDRISTVDLI